MSASIRMRPCGPRAARTAPTGPVSLAPPAPPRSWPARRPSRRGSPPAPPARPPDLASEAWIGETRLSIIVKERVMRGAMAVSAAFMLVLAGCDGAGETGARKTIEVTGEAPYVEQLKALGEMNRGDRKSTRLTPVTNAHLVCRLLLEKKKKPA